MKEHRATLVGRTGLLRLRNRPRSAETRIPKIAKDLSPLRYPGGKAVLTEYLARIIIANGLKGCSLYEPYCGGAGASIALLDAGVVSRVLLNDKNAGIYNFWRAVFYDTDWLLKRIDGVVVDIKEWHRQRFAYFDLIERTSLSPEEGRRLAFATFFLNRCNRSGILHAGPIGGRDQSGPYKIDCRFTKEALKKRIIRISRLHGRVEVKNLCGEAVLHRSDRVRGRDNRIVYLDPPYYVEGVNIYSRRFAFTKEQHASLAEKLKRSRSTWVLSYDDVDAVHELYSGASSGIVEFSYMINRTKVGKELILASSQLKLPILEVSSGQLSLEV